MFLHTVRGQRRSYAFSLEDNAPLRKMSKKELAHLYFPLAETDSAARHALLYLTQHARQDPGELTADDSLLWREDRKVYLMDVLHDLGYSECALKLSADQVAAILHFLGPVPDEEDCMEVD